MMKRNPTPVNNIEYKKYKTVTDVLDTTIWHVSNIIQQERVQKHKQSSLLQHIPFFRNDVIVHVCYEGDMWMECVME